MSFVDPYLLLALLFGSAAVLAWITKRLGLSYVAGYVMAGVLLSFLAPGVREGYGGLLDLFSDIAIALLAFEVGREVGLENIRHLRTAPLAIVLGELLASFTLMTAMGLILKLNWIDIAVLALMSSFCSTSITYKLMHERGLDFDKRRFVLSVAAIEDVAAIIFLALLPQLSRGYASLFDALKLVLLSVTIAATLVIVGIALLRSIFAKIVRPDELGLAISISLSFAYALVSRTAGLSPTLGAFAAGLALSTHPRSAEISELMRPIREMFLIVFFIVMGFNANMMSMSLLNIETAIVIGALIVLARLVFFSSLTWILSGYGLRDSLSMGFFAMTVGEFSMIVAYEAVRLKATSQPVIVIATLSTIVATIAASMLTKDFERRAERFSSIIPVPVKLFGDQVSYYINRVLEGKVSRAVREAFTRVVKECASMIIVAFVASSALYVIDSFVSYPYNLASTAVVIATAAFLIFMIIRRLRSHADFLCQEFVCKSGVADPRVRRLLNGLIFMSLTMLTVLLATLVASKYVEAIIKRVVGLDVGHLVASSIIVGLLALALWSIVSRLRRLASLVRDKGT
ncbi:MAG: cation:proton antiporter [Candidatus Verstraetearchaeota archaeon]|nr:cation:proton antiporter [Candidatus Verstraetearchaeota archaeon]